MTQYAVKYGDKLVVDHSWESVADVLYTFHGGFCDDQGRVTGVLVSRAGDGDEWVEVPA
jgi:hypothetical protein